MGKHVASERPVTDAEIIELFWKRNETAIQAIHHVYGSYLLQVALRILGSREDSEECQNDAYLALWNAIPPARPEHLLAFAVQILRHIAINRYRNNTRKSSIPTAMTCCLEELEPCLRQAQTVEELYAAREIGKVVNAYLHKQPEKLRYLFIARYYLAEPVECSAKALGISAVTAYRWLARMRAEIKSELEQEGITE